MRLVAVPVLACMAFFASSALEGSSPGDDFQALLENLDDRQVWAVPEGRMAITIRADTPAIFGVTVRQHGQEIRGTETLELSVVPGGDLGFLAPFGNYERFSRGQLEVRTGLELEWNGNRLDLDRALVVPAGADQAPGLRLLDARGRDVLGLTHLHVLAHPDQQRLEILNGDLVGGPGLVDALGFPDPDALFFGTVAAELDLLIPEGADRSQVTQACENPQWPQDGPEADVILISMRQIQQTGGGATTPDGAIKITPAAELEGAGEAEIPWVGKFTEIDEYTYEPRDQHPYLVWAMYRIHDGRVEMLGRSGAKHAYITVNTSCPCPGGNILWPGCRDEYGTGINDFGPDLGPRSDVEASLGLFETCGSFFDPDCVGEQTQGSGSGFLNRLVVHPDEFGLDGASYFIDSWYVVQYDVNIWNTMGYRPVDPQPVSGGWTFNPGTFAQGPPLGEWVAQGTTDPLADHLEIVVPSASPDAPYPGNMPQGRLRLLVRASEVGEGRYRYNYALQNFDFDRGVDRFSIPIAAGTEVHETWFGGPDDTPQWIVETHDEEVVFHAPEGEILPWFTLYNFEIEVSAPPAETTLALGLAGDAVQPVYEASTLGPATAVGVFGADPPEVDFGALAAGEVAEPEAVTLSNTGQVPITVEELVAPQSPFQLDGDCPNPPFELAPAESCELLAGFAPDESGTFSDAIVVIGDAENSPLSVPLTGQGLPPPEFSVTPMEVDFGSVETGQSAQATVELANAGEVDVEISGFVLPDAPFSVDAGDCGTPTFVLPPDAFCQAQVTFAPETEGAASGAWTIESEAGDFSVTLSGSGSSPLQPELVLSPSQIDFGPVEIPGPETASLALVNPGAVEVAVAAVELDGESFSLDAGDCGPAPFVLAPESQCQLSVTFEPSTADNFDGLITVQSDASGAPHVATLSGSGVEPPSPELSVTPTELDFGSVEVGSQSTRNVFLSNPGMAEVEVSALAGLDDPWNLDSSDCGDPPIVLDPEDDCALAVVFSPAQAGSSESVLQIISNADESPHEVALAGEGVEPVSELSVSPEAVDFGEVEVGQGQTEPVELSNPGSVEVEVLALVGPGAPFAVDPAGCGGASFSLPPGQACVLEISFEPDESGVAEAELVIESSAGDSPHLVSLAGEGTEPPTGDISLTPGSLDFGSMVAGAEGVLESVTLANTGTVSVTISDIQDLEPPFSLDASDCGGGSMTLEPGAECDLELFFWGEEPGLYSADLLIESDSPESPHTLEISGQIVPDQIFRDRFQIVPEGP